MPCRDYERDPGIEAAEARERASWFESTLCGVFTFLEKQPTEVLGTVLENMDYDEMGITRKEIEKWWQQHKVRDAQRRAAEAEMNRKQKSREVALAKLSTQEKKDLGLL